MRTLGEDCTISIRFSPIMLALCLMLFATYYAQNYAGIIGSGLECDTKLYNSYEVKQFVHVWIPGTSQVMELTLAKVLLNIKNPYYRKLFIKPCDIHWCFALQKTAKFYYYKFMVFCLVVTYR